MLDLQGYSTHLILNFGLKINCSAVLDCCHYGLSSAGGAMDIICVLFDATRSIKNQVVTQKNKTLIRIHNSANNTCSVFKLTTQPGKDRSKHAWIKFCLNIKSWFLKWEHQFAWVKCFKSLISYKVNHHKKSYDKNDNSPIQSLHNEQEDEDIRKPENTVLNKTPRLEPVWRLVLICHYTNWNHFVHNSVLYENNHL